MHRSAGAALLAALALSACSNQAGTISFRTLRRPIVRSHLRALAVSGTTGTIVAAGFDGAIARSTDSGFGWSAVTPASGRRLYGGAWGDGSFWLAGEAGTILRSTNDGRSFFPEHTPIPVRLSAVIATPGGRVVAAGDGGAILERGPSGWRVTRDPVPSEAGIRALAARRGGDLMVAVGYDGLALVERGGSWTRLPPIEADAIYGLTARDGALFGCGSFGAMLRSDDGGASWNPVPTDTRAFLRSISFSGAFGVAAGLGTILATQDGGEHWTAVLTHFPAQLLACAALSPARAIVAGEYGTLLATTDAGRTWTDATAGGAFPISALACPTMDAIVAIGAQGSVLRSTDGGTSFAPVAAPTKEDLSAIAFDDGGQHGLVATTSGTILGTTNLAASLEPAAAGLGRVRALLAVPGAFVAAGEGGRLSVSVDRGTTWEPGKAPGGQHLHALCAGDADDPYWAAGERGLLAHARKVGGAMMAVYSGIDRDLEAVAASGTYVYAAGACGTLVSSGNKGAGSSLHVFSVASAPTFRGIAASSGDPRRAIAVGDGGTVAVTRDGGLTWTTAILDARIGLTAVAWRGSRAIVAGDGGCLYSVAMD